MYIYMFSTNDGEWFRRMTHSDEGGGIQPIR